MKQRFFLAALVTIHALTPSIILPSSENKDLLSELKNDVFKLHLDLFELKCALPFLQKSESGYFNLTKEDKDALIQITASLALISIYCIALYINKKNQPCPYPSEIINESFASVAGAHEAKEALQEIVDFLKNPTECSRLGAKIPKGVLLTGQPGTGKTLLARAVAGEANCHFISVSGSEFEQVYVGLGAARVRELFEEARKKNGPCVIFIDEIDSIGGNRKNNATATWTNQTLNQLLTCMDGFSSKDLKHPIIVIGATNHESVLDPALLRPGRFDRIVHVPLPNLEDRIEILNIYLNNVVADKDLDVEMIAKTTRGFSGADLAQLVNQAALIATKNNQSCITIQNFHDAINLIMLGMPNKNIKMSAREKKITAYHEAGHTILHLLQPEITDEFYSVTIVARSRALGLMSYFPDENKYSLNKEEALAKICVLLAGRGSEELMFGEIGAGAQNDFERASHMAYEMVCSYGMSDLGVRIYDNQNISDATRDLIDKEVKKILDTQYAKVLQILNNNKPKLIKLSEELIKKETLYAPEVYKLLGLKPLAAAIA